MDWAVRPLALRDKAAVLTLWSNRMGDRFPHEGALDAALNPGLPTICFVAVTPADEVLGFAIGDLVLPLDAQELVRTDDRPDWATGSLGFLHTNCVAESAEGQGIGTCLVNRRLSALRERGAECFFAISWIREGSPDSSTIFERLGFNCVTTKPEFWYEESREHEYNCVDCGNPCTCTARVYVKEASV